MKKILSVDDNQVNQTLVFSMLSDNYDVSLVFNGREALVFLSSNECDLVLLDIDMPDMDGYEVCRQLKDDSDLADIPVIFVSGLTNIEDRMKGYDCGGIDYITKPIEEKILNKKIQIVFDNINRSQQLKAQLDFATQTAMTAMTNSGELGIVIEYMEKSFFADNENQLIQLLIDAISKYDLASCIQLRMQESIVTRSSCSSIVSELEKELLFRGQNAKRIVSLGHRALFNASSVSFLIRNMPIDDEGKWGRLKDHLASLLTASESRLSYIERINDKKKIRISSIEESLRTTESEIKNFQSAFSILGKETKQVMSELYFDLEESLNLIGLTKEQKEYFMKLVDETEQRIQTLTDWMIGMEQSLMQIEQGVKNTLEIERR